MDRSKRQPEYSKMLWHAYNSGACRGRAQNQRPLSLPVSLKATIFIRCLVQRSCFLLSPCAAPRSSTMVARTGPFARTSIRRVFESALLCGCSIAASGGRPLASLSNRLPTTVVLLCCDHKPWERPVDWVEIVGIGFHGLVES